ncbi:hypothetical protein AURDEDRAFT_87453 [Auricularia subglabra TFB-10046 SS5]|nr:hypothetical protein AURDEDRAFT_87453 [Auricularia subglabra TFB-10046 SS5]
MAEDDKETGQTKDGPVKEPGLVVVPAGGNMKEVVPSQRWIYSSSGNPQFVHHKSLPIKRSDGEPLMREDLQYDFLLAIFTNQERAFTDTSSAAQQRPRHPSGKATFAELYINAILSSNKCTKIQRDKMNDTPAFARDFAMMCLLVNVGRVNTTLAFYPEMRTVLRTYHPVPALQKTDGNLQDAPRMKSVLKGCLLADEIGGQTPTTPADIRALARGGKVPSTSAVNLIFALTNHCASVSRQHFQSPLDFHDLFLPVNISSRDRANAFLWLMYDYLEGITQPNPFVTPEWTASHPDQVPQLTRLTQQEMERENVDPPDEVELSRQMIANRRSFVQEHVTNTAGAGAKNGDGGADTDEPAGGGNGNKKKRPGVNPGEGERPAKKSKKDLAPGKDKEKNTKLPPDDEIIEIRDSPTPTPAPVSSSSRHGGTKYQERVSSAVAHRERPAPPPEEKKSFQRPALVQAFYVVSRRDALYDSDDELDTDENARIDYQRRLEVLRRLRGKDVTPEPERRREDDHEHDYRREHSARAH